MKNILLINSDCNCVYDIHMVTNKEFDMLFLPNTNVSSLGAAKARHFKTQLDDPIRDIMFYISFRRIPKRFVKGIHGILYVDIDSQIFDLTLPSKVEEFNESQDMIYMRDWHTWEYEFQNFYKLTANSQEKMYNLLYIDATVQCGGVNSVIPEVYACTEEEYNVLFPCDTDITFLGEIGEVYGYKKGDIDTPVSLAMGKIWKRRVPLINATNGIHGTLYDLALTNKNIFYPTRKDEEAMNPDGSRLRLLGACANQKTAFPIYEYLNHNEEAEWLDKKSYREGWKVILEQITDVLGFEYYWEWSRNSSLRIYQGWNFPEPKNSPYLNGDDLYAYIQEQNDN